MTRTLTGIVFAVASVWLSQAVFAEDKKLSDADQKFLQTANEIGMAEIKLGKMAREEGASPAVKKFGERMVTDHTRIAEDLSALAKRKGVNLAQDLDKKHQELSNQLSKLRGADFDRAYSKDMVMGHQVAIEKFENEIKNGQDPDVKAFAEKWVKTLREHLELARTTAKDVR